MVSRRPLCVFALVVGLLTSAVLSNSPLVMAAEVLPPLSERFANVPAEGPFTETPNFQRHVVALFGRLGCNGRNCHGSFQGRGGFRLSMFGYDFATDHAALVSEVHPRVNVKDPAASLILNKPTSDEDHEGGKRFDRNGWEYRVLRAWVAAGAKNDSDKAGKMLRLEITPAELVFRRPDETAQMRVVAVWADGTREDVTCLARFSSNDDAVATVDDHGLVRSTGRGDTYIIASYDNGVESTPVLMPVTDLAGDNYPKVATHSKIDELVIQKLRKLGVVPSEVCSDAEFLRRVSLDITGTLPTAAETARFAADAAADKRHRKIDALLESPAYALWWSTKFCDFTGLNGPLYLGNTEFGPLVTEQWRSWLERKVRDNVPYDKLVEGMVVVVSRKPEQSYEDYALAMSGYVRKENPVDFTARETMPHYWFRGNLATADDKALAFAYSFMGVRLDCAQCHKHPFDRWSQQDFKQFAAIFDRVRWGVSPASQPAYDKMKEELDVAKLNTAAIRRQTYWRWAGDGKVAPWPEVFIAAPDDINSGSGAAQRKQQGKLPPPKLLGDDEIDAAKVDDPRRPLMAWLRKPDNPYFARAFVNRVWSHYFGRGIVEPADDLNLGNPPSNKELLDHLAQSLIANSYDMKSLHREITRSDAYQRSWHANDSNRHDERNFSRAVVRRLPAEVAVDAMLMATANDAQADQYQTQVKNRKIGIQATADHVRTEFSLAVFGKPLRTVNCDCEREQEPSLAQAIFVRNDQDLYTMLDRRDGWLAALGQRKPALTSANHAMLIEAAYRRALSRSPTAAELARSEQHLAAAESTLDGLRDLMWALLNTQEFITNH